MIKANDILHLKAKASSYILINSFIKYFMAGVDTVGGVRVPAGFCGIIGFRPSYGTIPHLGILPVSASLDSVGMCRW